MRKNKSGFSIIIGMGLVILMTLSAYLILSYIIPFSQNTKGIENSSNAYYLSYGGIEKALYFIGKERTPADMTTETGSNMPNTLTGISYETFSSGSSIPKPGEGNSEYDKDYNTISITEGLQLEVGNNMIPNWSGVNFIFKVPNLDLNNTTSETLSGLTLPIINWMLSTDSDTLSASGTTYIEANGTTGVKSSNCSSSCSWQINNKNGVILDGSPEIFNQAYYNSNCGAGSSCILKFSIINPLILSTGNKVVPYLEYQISGLGGGFPDKYAKIISSGKSYGFQKSLEIKIPQQLTTNQALDFTVFQ
ncbi:MAG: hypothetical protein PHE25_01035 [Candidatus Gracilibacteria bacterium]|nr:hypothetical protein [Candidatus Gracilibacteria bacterium]